MSATKLVSCPQLIVTKHKIDCFLPNLPSNLNLFLDLLSQVKFKIEINLKLYDVQVFNTVNIGPSLMAYLMKHNLVFFSGVNLHLTLLLFLLFFY